ncbi:unnamed protein product [Pleuronectes platessa]|uniref:Uncharacterized protein n=1 Tax=Pleuronectes platessa TaxID=8262 RepID=A0A9N7VX51_PLEPL|nr:unnamed protein product [Pleuronectes platessa]
MKIVAVKGRGSVNAEHHLRGAGLVKYGTHEDEDEVKWRHVEASVHTAQPVSQARMRRSTDAIQFPFFRAEKGASLSNISLSLSEQIALTQARASSAPRREARVEDTETPSQTALIKPLLADKPGAPQERVLTN